ncbi:MAG: NAD(P)/FAD-dependent oxidoreductase [Bacilli bacterium]|nr:NAD(P)/FAD-dependent oxidoreductase [Bacilli bacterium]
MYDFIIIGAGVVGAFIARKLSRYETNVLLIEKENDVGNVTSNANSAIIHSGYDPVPGTLKAKLNVLGNKMYDQVCSDLDVKMEKIGSLTVATSEEQMKMFDELLIRSKVNGVEVRLVNQDELRKMEPNISPNALGALFAPSAGIIDPFNLVIHCVENAVDNGVTLKLNEEVSSIEEKDGVFFVKTNKNTYQGKIVINAAGLGSEKVARMIEDVDWNLIPRKGEYFVLDHYKKGFVNHTIFPLPSAKGKGVLVSPTSSGDYIVGPSSEPVEDASDFSTDLFTLNNVKAQALDLVPNIPFVHQIRVFSGIRPTTTRHDFIIESSDKYKNFINVAGIESPGFVSSPAIAEYVFDNIISKLVSLKEKANYNPKVRPYVCLNDLSSEERNFYINKNKDYGTMICSCEKVSLGEIKDLFTRSVPPRSIKGVKRRVRAGYGKCQGGFCSPKVALILAKKLNCSPLDINYDNIGSNVLLEEVKK